MNKLKRIIYVLLGILAFILGAIGVILPVLPTTPFLLLASFCFVKGSDRFNKWFIETKIYKKHLETFVKERAMTLRKKIVLIVFADTMMIMAMLAVKNKYMTIGMIILILYKLYYFKFKIKTIKV